jgi:hypothetical protein
MRRMKHKATGAVIILASTIVAIYCGYEAVQNESLIVKAVAIMTVVVFISGLNWIGWDSMPRRHRTIIKATRGPERGDEDFIPDMYYRLVRRLGWRNVIVEIDEAIENPDAEIIPVRSLFTPEVGQIALGQIWPVVFEYRGQTFRGYIHK